MMGPVVKKYVMWKLLTNPVGESFKAPTCTEGRLINFPPTVLIPAKYLQQNDVSGSKKLKLLQNEISMKPAANVV